MNSSISSSVFDGNRNTIISLCIENTKKIDNYNGSTLAESYITSDIIIYAFQ